MDPKQLDQISSKLIEHAQAIADLATALADHENGEAATKKKLADAFFGQGA